ncbi:MAG: sigma-70 family RNA polymerase sigma factor [bacterium]|nr:sigma-70 family RNA polymerase sigma factor [bacterium]
MKLINATDNAKALHITDEQIKYARRIAGKMFRERSLPIAELGELESAALVGLCRAAIHYRKRESEAPETYYYIRIKGAILDYIRGEARYSKSRSKARYRLIEESQDTVHQEVVHRIAGAPVDEVKEALNIDIRSLGCEGSECCYADDEGHEEYMHRTQLRETVQTFINELPLRQKAVIEGVYYQGRTLDEIRPRLENLSRATLCRDHAKAVGTLRKRITSVGEDLSLLVAAGTC